MFSPTSNKPPKQQNTRITHHCNLNTCIVFILNSKFLTIFIKKTRTFLYKNIQRRPPYLNNKQIIQNKSTNSILNSPKSFVKTTRIHVRYTVCAYGKAIQRDNPSLRGCYMPARNNAPNGAANSDDLNSPNLRVISPIFDMSYSVLMRELSH